MYKVAFPGATEDDEKREMDWVGRPSPIGAMSLRPPPGQVLL